MVISLLLFVLSWSFEYIYHGVYLIYRLHKKFNDYWRSFALYCTRLKLYLCSVSICNSCFVWLFISGSLVPFVPRQWPQKCIVTWI
jgi:hypothetical protein